MDKNVHGVIYGLHDPETGELRYIGQTITTVKARLAVHVSPSQLKKHSYVARWLLGLVRRGLEPTWSVLAEASDQEELDRLEIKLIALARDEGVRLVNLSDGGGGRAGWATPPEVREKIRRSNLGKPHPKHTPEWKALMSEKMRGRNTNTPEHIERLRQMKIGVPRSEETRAKISEARKGIPSPMRGKHHTEETKAKVSASRKGKLTGDTHHQYDHDISTEWILAKLDEGWTKVAIAKELGKSPTFVHRRVNQARRTLGEGAYRRKRLPEEAAT